MTFGEGLTLDNLVLADCPGKKSKVRIISDTIKSIEGEFVILKCGARTLKNSIRHVYVKDLKIENPNYNKELINTIL